MVEISIGLGIFLSLVLSETLGVTAGGIIVPGYIALYLHEPLQVLVTFFVAILVWAIIQGMGKVMFLYGKRRIVLALILGFFFGYISRNFMQHIILEFKCALITYTTSSITFTYFVSCGFEFSFA